MDVRRGRFRRRFRGETAATAVEYAIMVSLIAVVIFMAVSALGSTTSGTFDEASEGLSDGTGSTGPGTDPGTGPGTDPGTGPGTDPGTGPGTDPGTGPGTDPGCDKKSGKCK
jgi:Flp pilus assembly pilin Flp